jgi:hypothetical protein
MPVLAPADYHRKTLATDRQYRQVVRDSLNLSAEPGS